MYKAQNYIAGEWLLDGQTDQIESVDPANGKVLGQAQLGSTAIAEKAIEVARETFETSTWTGDMRLRYRVLMQFADALERKKEELTDLLVQENGKVRGQAHHEVVAAINEARYYAGLARNIFGRTLESEPHKFSLITREPAGVVSVIVPWNAPVTLLVRSLAPALAAGCTTIIKPAPQTPLINAAVLACLDEIEELPRGVINSVNENGIEVGTVLAAHPEIDVITFTGSSRTGAIIMEKAAPTIKRLSLELGGKSPAVVCADADIDQAVSEVVRCSIVLNGQMCTAISRAVIDEKIADEFTDKLLNAYQNVQLGHGLDAGTDLGPLIDHDNQKRVLGVIDRINADAEMLLQGAPGDGELANGSFISPTLFKVDDVASPLVQEEHFAPMVSIETFSDEEQAVEMANATRFGLAASLYTQDLNRAMRMSREIRMGSVWLNCHNRQMAEVETGGFRESGVGRLHGVEAMHDFLETKHIYLEAGS